MKKRDSIYAELKAKASTPPKMGMVPIINSGLKCFCGHPFDQEGVCANGHLQNETYNVPENMTRKKVQRRKSYLNNPHICKRFGTRCGICGAYIPECDNVCDNGHILGIRYSAK